MRRIYLSVYLLFLIISLTTCDERGPRVRRIVGGKVADVPPADDPVVYTRFNGKTARIQGTRDFPHYVFRGIRYAEPPVGRDRFLRPKEHFLSGNVDATAFAPPCVQPDLRTNKIIGKEDCLFLNIFTPDLPSGSEGLPVVIWIHGGGFRMGSASQYGVRHLVAQRIIIITIQYRLGSLGFLTSESQELPGNAALWDMALAVQWVRNYIGFFGGNPYRIVVMGQGSGGSSALLVTLSNIAKGLSGVIAMSGSAVSNWAVTNTPSNTAWKVAEANGCPNTSLVVIVKCLQQVPAESIIEGDNVIEFERTQMGGFMTGMSGRSASTPRKEGVHDGWSLPAIVQREPVQDIAEKKNPKIPLLTGITKDETKRAVQVEYKDEIIDKLKTVPEFIDKIFAKNLEDAVKFKDFISEQTEAAGSLLGGFGNLDPLQFRSYLKTASNNVLEELERISDATADALFNLPAFLTADLWSKSGTPSYLYSFEHSGKAKKGYSFLKGLPLVGDEPPKDDLNGTVAHGDDLAYLFDANDIYGQPLEKDDLTDEDIEVRNVYTKMIADFARYGKVSVGKDYVNPFSSTDNNFIQIKPKPKVQNGFRYCEMGLWLGLADRLKSQTCSILKQFDFSKIPLANGLEDLGKGDLFGKNVLPTDILGNQKSGNKSNNMMPDFGNGNVFGQNVVPTNIFGSQKQQNAKKEKNVVPGGMTRPKQTTVRPKMDQKKGNGLGSNIFSGSAAVMGGNKTPSGSFGGILGL